MSTNLTNRVLRIAGVALFGALSLASVLVFLHVFAPGLRPNALTPFEGYDQAPMDAALAPDRVRGELDTILGFGSRFPGQEGFTRTQKHVECAFRDAGLSVLTLPVHTAVPHTERREILGADGVPLRGVEIYPFWPNHLQPMVTPAEGLTGTLLLVTDEVLLKRPSFDGVLAVVDAAAPPKMYGMNWVRYAELGCRAVIVAHREGLGAMNWGDPESGFTAMVANTPVNYVRLAAGAGVFSHLGETVTLHVRTSWRDVQQKAVIGILKGGERNPEAVVVTASSEACSMLPDLAPGVLTALEPAVMLASLRGILPYRDQLRRDVVFISYASRVMAHLTADSVAAIAGSAINPGEACQAIVRRQQEDRGQAAAVRDAAACFDNPGFLGDAEVTQRVMDSLEDRSRAVLEEEIRYVLNSLLLERSEIQLRLRVAFEEAGGGDLKGPAFAAYRAAKRSYDEALDAASFTLVKLCRKKAGFLQRNGVRERCREHFEELARFHARRAAELESARSLNQTLGVYDRLTVFSPGMLPADSKALDGELFTFTMGSAPEDMSYLQPGVQNPIMNQVLHAVVRGMDLPEGVQFQSLRTENPIGWVSQQTAGLPLDVRYWNLKGNPSFALVNVDRKRSYAAIGAPVELPYMRDLDTVRHTMRAYGRTLLSLAFGNAHFEPPLKKLNASMEYSGRLFVAGVGRSMVPNYPLGNGLVGHKGFGFNAPGYYPTPFFFADVYGRYDLPSCSVPIAGSMSYSPEAVGYGPDGLIRFIKDQGKTSQRVYKSSGLGWSTARSDVNIVLFRATPLTLLDMINPQTLKAYASAGFVTQEGLAAPDSINEFSSDGLQTAFLPPDKRFFVTLRAGAMENELVQTTRAFILGDENTARSRGTREIDGRGFLPLADTLILDVPARIAQSMLRVNGSRLALQDKYGMADDRTRAFHANSAALLGESRQPERPKREETLLSRDAATYAILNHPVLRESVSEAVFSILWYLGLLVPFVFFFEKLVFGFPDIRKQLGAEAVIFVVVFALLRLLHPAFQMINSSLMILLGFVIMLIAGGVTILFSSKFQDNLDELKKRRARVATAEVNTMGMVGTAFALGLNNMHRRFVRTGLTCATLVLITFTMICFTSVQSDIVETERVLGKAAYQGLLVKPPKFEPISAAEAFALDYRFGDRFDVATRSMLVGRQEWDRVNYNPVLEVAYRPADGKGVALPAGSLLSFEPAEPLRDRIRLLTSRGWFDGSGSVMLPDAMAQKLGIRPATVDREEVFVTVNGERVRVHGIFDARSLNELRDLDGSDLLPFDLTAVRTIEGDTYVPLVDAGAPRIGAENILLACNFTVEADHGSRRTTSVAIAMPALRYEEARAEVTRYLEQNGHPAFYGLGDSAYWGQRARKRTVAGIIELLVPLLIAAMTVLNTMRGSVYERRDEIYVYNAVGIAPKYIFSMFFTEAFVYTVVGSVLGYLLSQGTGCVLTALGWTGGLNMTFTTSATIHASLAIAAAVFLSTIFPARQALRIAAPAEDAGWSLPEPDGDRLSFLLPFTFGVRDRIAVLAFLNRYLLDHGEGGAGRFFSAEPGFFVTGDPTPQGGERPVPELRTTIWPKPFDLGVSQQLSVALPTDPDTREFIVRITLTRLSGTRESWMLLNHVFVALLRRQFLHWRAVSPADRHELFEEAKQRIEGIA